MPVTSRPAWPVTAAVLAATIYLTGLLAAGPAPVLLVLAFGALAAGSVAAHHARRLGGSADGLTGFLRRTADVHVLVAALLAGLTLQSLVTEGVTSDGCLYFAHLRSLIFDWDLQVEPELRDLRLPPRPHHVVSFGGAVVWLPLYLIVRLADLAGLAGWLDDGRAAVLPGLGPPYVRAALISSYVVAAAGVVALHLRLRREFGAAVALASSALLFGGTTVAWYALYEPAMPHAVSFGAAAFFLLAVERWARHPSRGAALTTGLLYSLIIVVRPQDGLFGIFLLAALAAAGPVGFAPRVRHLGWAALGALPILALQAAVVAALLADQPFRLAGEGGYLRLADSRWMDVLFSSWHGLFSWTPVAYLAAIGTVFYVSRDAWWGLSALAVFAAMTWINGSASDWWAGWAYGGRRFTSSLAALAPGLALAIHWLRGRPMLVLAPIVVAALAWNSLLMLQYHHGLVPRNEPVRFDRMVRQQVDLGLERLGASPLAFPANVWFAWREGVPVDRYDLLAPAPLGASFALTLDEKAAPFLLDGWSDRVAPSVAVGPKATLVVPLDPPRAPPLVLEIDASTEPSSTPLRVAVRVDVNGHDLGEAVVGPARETFRFVSAPAGVRRQVWRKGYNRITFQKLRAVTAGDEAGGRVPGSGARPGLWPMAVYAVRIDPRPAGFSGR